MGGSLGLCSVSVECGQRGREHAVGMSCAEPVKRPEWEGDPSRRGGCVWGGASRAGWHVSKAREEVKVSGEGHSMQREQSRPGP